MIRGTGPCSSPHTPSNETKHSPICNIPIPVGCYRISQGKITVISKEDLQKNVYQGLQKTNHIQLTQLTDVSSLTQDLVSDIFPDIFPDITWDSISDIPDFPDLHYQSLFQDDGALKLTPPQKSSIEISTSKQPSPTFQFQLSDKIERKPSPPSQLGKRKLEEKSTDHKQAKVYYDRINALHQSSLENQFPLILPKGPLTPPQKPIQLKLTSLKLQDNRVVRSLLPKFQQ